jgi:hypothetical protein
MITRNTDTGHLDGGELVRLIDGEGGPADRARWHVHLETCPRCREEADRLRDGSDAVSRWLAAADFEGRGVPTTPVASRDRGPGRATGGRPATRAWLKAAVIVLVMATPVVAIPAVRDWVADRAGLGQPAAPAGPATETLRSPDAGPVPSVIRFVPVPGDFALVVEAGQRTGSLSLGRTAGDEAILEMTAGEGGAEPVVSARALRIRNTASATGSYHLLLPAEVTTVSVRIAGREQQVEGGALDRQVVIPLGHSP